MKLGFASSTPGIQPPPPPPRPPPTGPLRNRTILNVSGQFSRGRSLLVPVRQSRPDGSACWHLLFTLGRNHISVPLRHHPGRSRPFPGVFGIRKNGREAIKKREPLGPHTRDFSLVRAVTDGPGVCVNLDP